jgi:hypothetical protein
MKMGFKFDLGEKGRKSAASGGELLAAPEALQAMPLGSLAD